MAGPTIWRREFIHLKKLSKPGTWLLVYGRRKTGKTYIATRILRPTLYITITTTLQAITITGTAPKHQTIDEALKTIAGQAPGTLVVIDEFQRLPPRYWDYIAATAPDDVGLILLASSHSITRKVFDTNSPLLGLVYPYHLSIIHYSDALASLAPRLEPPDALLWALVLRDPWITRMPGLAEALERGLPPWAYIARNAPMLYTAAHSLTGEVFTEEERQYTRTYQAVLRLTATGKWNTATIAHTLYQRRLLQSPQQGQASALLDRMASIGLISKIRLWKTRHARVYYHHTSPLLATLYALAEHHAIDETPPPPTHVLEKTARHTLARELQFSIGELLAQHTQTRQAYTILPRQQGDIDIVLLHPTHDKPLAAYEVKTGKCTHTDQKKLAQRAALIGAPEHKLICLAGAPENLDAATPEDLIRTAIQTTKNTTQQIKEGIE